MTTNFEALAIATKKFGHVFCSRAQAYIANREKRCAANKLANRNNKACGRRINVQSDRMHKAILSEISDKRQALIHAHEWAESHFIGKKLKP